MTSTPTPKPGPGTVTELRSLDDDVATYLEITEQMEQLGAQLAAVRHRLADRGPGRHTTTDGQVTVTVSAPNRSFNFDRAWALLNDEQKAVCVSADAAKVKAQLPQVLLDTCWDEGKGSPRVLVK